MKRIILAIAFASVFASAAQADKYRCIVDANLRCDMGLNCMTTPKYMEWRGKREKWPHPRLEFDTGAQTFSICDWPITVHKIKKGECKAFKAIVDYQDGSSINHKELYITATGRFVAFAIHYSEKFKTFSLSLISEAGGPAFYSGRCGKL